MASNNRDPFLGSAGVGDSPFERHSRRIGNMVVDLMDYSGRIGEDRAHARSGPIIAELEARLNASEAGAAQAKTDADVRIAQYTSDLETRNAQMVETVAETVERLKRDAAARVAAAESHAQDCIDDARDRAESQIRELSQDRDRHADMVGLGRKHAAWAQHKLRLLLEEMQGNMGYHHQHPLVTFLYEICEDFGWFRNECDNFLGTCFLYDDEVPDLGPVPDEEGGTLFNRPSRNSSEVTSPRNTEEKANREENPLFIDDHHQKERDDRVIKTEDEDIGQQIGVSANGLGQLEQSHTDLSPSTKRASDSEGQTGHSDKRQRTE
ncbi:hypothetical protein FOMG_15509 [Fusarium oxysporum f. sp. melonis 26406]|uniref:Uncharacterized protein n=1 Tax=Fusarium oxysporum f. sp. melonis 26406 TaxID=1089452 RepID=W9Z9N2_FUSOX|nr:hypothetical protein FOMG_15509 [Fusarium oxysporum f. sp. melonis 26406]EXK28050.1 hypothetical protein FOMG_15509 [Fusarium oxysporum f. sp. melonis 26406]